jgi:phage repressor protein C with HTH and peptisase S24 domain
LFEYDGLITKLMPSKLGSYHLDDIYRGTISYTNGYQADIAETALASELYRVEERLLDLKNMIRIFTLDEYSTIHLVSPSSRSLNAKNIYHPKAITGENKNVNLPSSENENVGVFYVGKNRGNSKSIDLPLQKEANLEGNTSSNFLPVGNEVLNILNQHFIDIPLLDVAAAANSISGFIANDHPEVTDHILLPNSMAKRGKKYIGFPVVSDSMSPTLYVNDILIVSLSDKDSIKDGFIYVIATKDNGVIVKRVKNRLREHGFISCRSDNRIYKSINIQENDIVSIFEVLCKIGYNLSNDNVATLDLISKLEDRIDDIEARIPPKQQ